MRTPLKTRRQMIAAAALAGYGLSRGEALAADGPPKSDPELLRELLAVELLLITVYRRVLAMGLLSRRVHRVAVRVLAQERAHAGALRRELRRLGGSVPPAISRSEAIDKALLGLKVSGQLEALHNEHDCVQLLLALETAAQGAYYNAISQLHSLDLGRMAAEILASEAQHQTAVSEARRPGNVWQAAPRAFVKGNSS